MARTTPTKQRRDLPSSGTGGPKQKKKKLSRLEKEQMRIGDYNTEGLESPHPDADDEGKRKSRARAPVYMDVEHNSGVESESEEERKVPDKDWQSTNRAAAPAATTQTTASDTESEDEVDADITIEIDDSQYVQRAYTSSNEELAPGIRFDTATRLLHFDKQAGDFSRIDGEVIGKGYTKMVRNLRCRRYLKKATRIFRYIVNPDIKSGGRSGNVWSGNYVLYSCVDVQKVSATSYGINEKVLIDFRGYHLTQVQIGNRACLQVRRVSATVRRLDAVYGRDVTGGQTEEAHEGFGRHVIRWADVRDIWQDYLYSMKLIKYFVGNGVDDDYWRPTYDQYWPRATRDPYRDLKWRSNEEL